VGEKLMLKEFIIINIVFLFLIVGCTLNPKVPPPQKGGTATINLASPSPSIVVSQPENSSAPTISEYEREIIPFLIMRTNLQGAPTESVSNLVWVVVKDKYKTILGEQQSDAARNSFGDVQKHAITETNKKTLYYIGGGLIVLGLILGALKNYFPFVGVKTVAGCFFFGIVCLCLPQIMSSLVMQIATAVGTLFYGYIIIRKFDNNENKDTNKI
jgi:hypothetical protein